LIVRQAAAHAKLVANAANRQNHDGIRDLRGNSDIDAVRSATDLVRLIGEHVALRPKGREHVGLCPFHSDKNPSFCVVTHKGNAFYKCHACGAGGDAFDFVMNYHRMEFGEALRLLADRAGIKLTPRTRPENQHSGNSQESGSGRAELRKANLFAATFFQRMLNDQQAGAAARQVIANRTISDEMVHAFMLGAAPNEWDALSTLISKRELSVPLFLNAGLLKKRKEGDGHYDAFRNRLIFPICDDVGNPIAFGARKIDPADEPKYLNSSESPLFSKSKTLYGLHRAKRAIIESKQAIVTEGYTDVIACHQARICNVVATLGTALTRDHARVLSRLCDTVVLVFDGDEAGQKAADRGLEVFFNESVDIRICVLPDELDPDELLKQPDGRDRFEQAISNSIDALEFKIERFKSTLNHAQGISARHKRLESFLLELADMGFNALQGVKKRLVLARLADIFGISIADIEFAMPKPRPQVTAPEPQGHDLADEAEYESPFESAQPAIDVSKARSRAESDVLAMWIYQPDLLRCGHSVRADEFIDPVNRIVAEVILSLIQQERHFTVQQLLSTITQPSARQLVSSLYFEGERLCENASTSPAETFQRAVQSLREHISLDEYQQSLAAFRRGTNAPQEALLSLIEKRRKQGHIASAIVRGVRS
jgi:DNA primase